MKLDDAFGLHAHALQLRSRRGEVLAANMANADTPGYKARDFDFQRLLQRELGTPVRLVATNPGHIQTDRSAVPAMAMQYRIPHQPSLDGNTVEAEAEQARYSANAMQYQASLSFLDGRIKSLLAAITGN